MATVLGRSGVMGSSSFLTGWGGFVAATGKEAISVGLRVSQVSVDHSVASG
jgi:hypothetical protein